MKREDPGLEKFSNEVEHLLYVNMHWLEGLSPRLRFYKPWSLST